MPQKPTPPPPVPAGPEDFAERTPYVKCRPAHVSLRLTRRERAKLQILSHHYGRNLSVLIRGLIRTALSCKTPYQDS